MKKVLTAFLIALALAACGAPQFDDDDMEEQYEEEDD